MNKKIIAAVGAVVVAVIIFFGGMKFGQAHAQPANAFMAGNFPGRGQGMVTFANRAGARGANGGIVAGEILSKDATGITVKMQNGSKIVITSASTQISKQTTGTMNDLMVGTNVNVIGTANTDGSITAQSIQIRPAGMFGSTTPNRQ